VLALPAGHWLAHASGTLSAVALPLPGTVGTAQGNVQLTLDRASSLVAEGDWGTMTIAVTSLDLVGGVPQPPLAGFVDAGRGLVCSDRVATARRYTVWLGDVAQGRGALVQAAGPRAGGVRLPPGFVVPAGARAVTVTARIDPGFVGPARLTAAAGGVERVIDLVVHPHNDCLTR